MTAAELAEAALHELREREVTYPQLISQQKKDPGEAGRTIAAWRAIVALLRCGETAFEPCLGLTPAEAWPEVVAAAHAACEHRLRVSLRTSSTDAERQMLAIRQTRDLLLRSAVRAGATLPSFDAPATVGVDGPATKTQREAA
jgi:hypothetical protein